MAFQSQTFMGTSDRDEMRAARYYWVGTSTDDYTKVCSVLIFVSIFVGPVLAHAVAVDMTQLVPERVPVATLKGVDEHRCPQYRGTFRQDGEGRVSATNICHP